MIDGNGGWRDHAILEEKTGLDIFLIAKRWVSHIALPKKITSNEKIFSNIFKLKELIYILYRLNSKQKEPLKTRYKKLGSVTKFFGIANPLTHR